MDAVFCSDAILQDIIIIVNIAVAENATTLGN